MPNKKSRESVPQYSYRHSLKKEEIKLYKRIGLILVGFFVILLILWFAGTTFINSLALLSRDSSDNSTANTSSELPLITPKFTGLPEQVNTDSITVNGETTSDVTVVLFVNGKQIKQAKSDTSGLFKFEAVTLTTGDNLVKVIVENKAAEKKEVSATVKLDKTKPGLSVTAPAQGTSYPDTTKNITVSGSTEAEAVVYINGSQTVVDGAGKFSFNLPVTPGANTVEVTSTDAAGNITTVKVGITVASNSPEAEE